MGCTNKPWGFRRVSKQVCMHRACTAIFPSLNQSEIGPRWPNHFSVSIFVLYSLMMKCHYRKFIFMYMFLVRAAMNAIAGNLIVGCCLILSLILKWRVLFLLPAVYSLLHCFSTRTNWYPLSFTPKVNFQRVRNTLRAPTNRRPTPVHGSLICAIETLLALAVMFRLQSFSLVTSQ